jgi:hypothetical protein
MHPKHLRFTFKLLHTVGAIGMGGALAAMLVLMLISPEPASLVEYAQMRKALGAVAEWVLFPSLGLCLVSGLLAMAAGKQFHSAGWAWVKLLFGVVSFEGTLLAVQSPAQREAILAAAVLAGEAEADVLGNAMHNEWASVLVIMGVVMLNVVLGIWRPRLRGRRPAPVGEAAG